MSKYLIRSKEGFYISSSKNARKHTMNTCGDGIMIYDKNGVLINSTKKIDDGKFIIYGDAFFDGRPRQWAIDFIENNKVGTMIKDEKHYL